MSCHKVDKKLVGPSYKEVAAKLRHRSEHGVLTLSASHRSAMREINGLRLDYELPLAARLQLTGTAGLNQVASELAILRDRPLCRARGWGALRSEIKGEPAGRRTFAEQSAASSCPPTTLS